MLTAPRLHALALTLALALALASCSSGDEDVAGGVGGDEVATAEGAGELFPERTGDPVAVTSGGEDGAGWEVTAQESVEGTCILVDDELARQTEACGFEVPNLHDVGFFDHTGIEGSPVVFAGVAATEVATVRLVLDDATSLDTPVLRLDGGFPTAFFAVEVAGPAQVVEVVALGAGGEELERRPA